MDIPADDPVIIVPYDPTWPDVFDRIREEIAAVLGSTALAIEHIGSTAVPGLSAKPVIDIDVVVSSPAGITTAIEKLAPLGYRFEGRHAFKQPDHLPAHHLYACAADNLELARHIAFRDHLRANALAARDYERLKKRLAATFGSDREGYTTAKTSFISAVLQEQS